MIAVIDYGMGNLRSIAKALAHVGADVVTTREPERIREASHIVIPGVGAFGQGMDNLRAFGLIPVLEEEVLAKKKPFWGICLGMQLLMERSEEFGTHAGLGWVPGQVKRFAFSGPKPLAVPHVGWNSVECVHEHPVAPKKRTDFYFVHSYYVAPKEDQWVVGTCEYGVTFPACIGKGNIFATQFHPEKSQEDGLTMLKKFCAWRP
jgi:glutamine amidotransferase